MTPRVTALVGAVLLATGCAGAPRAEGDDRVATQIPAPHEVHWSYTGPTGPDAWGKLAPEFALCERGTRQSPIDIANATVDPTLPELQMERGDRTVSLTNNGHTLQASLADGGTLRLGGRSYDMVQFHYHHPSEHTIGGRAADVELHFVHRDDEGKLAVLGVLLEEGATASPAIGILLRAARGAENEAVTVSFDPASSIPSLTSYTRYDGSLTTPPCTEGVHWIVLNATGTVSRQQLEQLEHALGRNARPVMPRAGRDIQRNRVLQ